VIRATPIVALAALVALAGAACTQPAAETVAGPPSPSPAISPSPSPRPIFAEMPALTDPATVAMHVTTAERALRNPATDPGELPMLGRVQQAAYRKLVEETEWRQAALQEIPEDLRATAAANIEAGAELRALTRPAEKLPDWKIIEPPPSEALLNFYREAEAEFGVPWVYLASIHLVETRMGRIRGDSSAGAQGPMQFIPSTWARYGQGDINDPRDSIFAAARYLKAAGAPGNMPKALYAYNHSDRYVRGITLYAEEMIRDERAYLAYYHWLVYVRTVNGDVLLEVGWEG